MTMSCTLRPCLHENVYEKTVKTFPCKHLQNDPGLHCNSLNTADVIKTLNENGNVTKGGTECKREENVSM